MEYIPRTKVRRIGENRYHRSQARRQSRALGASQLFPLASSLHWIAKGGTLNRPAVAFVAIPDPHRASGRSPDLQTPFFRPGGVLMRPDDSGIDDQIFEVRIIGHRLEDPPPDTLDAPSTEAPEHAVPVSERFRKITPGRARTYDPKHTFHEHPV